MKKAIEKAQEAYRQAQKNADNKTCELLEADTFKPKDVNLNIFRDLIEQAGNLI